MSHLQINKAIIRPTTTASTNNKIRRAVHVKVSKKYTNQATANHHISHGAILPSAKTSKSPNHEESNHIIKNVTHTITTNLIIPLTLGKKVSTTTLTTISKTITLTIAKNISHNHKNIKIKKIINIYDTNVNKTHNYRNSITPLPSTSSPSYATTNCPDATHHCHCSSSQISISCWLFILLAFWLISMAITGSACLYLILTVVE